MRKKIVIGIIAEFIAILMGIFSKNIFLFIIINIVFILLFISVEFINNIYIDNKLNKSRNSLLIDLLEVTTWELDLDLEILRLNIKDAHKGKIAEILTLNKFLSLIDKNDKEKVEALIKKMKDEYNEGVYEIIFKIKDFNGSKMPIKTLFTIKDRSTRIIPGVAINLTKQIEQDKKIKNSEKIYRLAILGTRDMLFYWNIDSGEITLKGKIQELIDIEDESVKVSRKEFFDAIHKWDRKKIEDIYIDCSKNKIDFIDEEFRMKSNKGVFYWLSLRGKIYNENNEKYMYGSISNISDRKAKEEQIEYISYYDEITGLPNRRLFREEAEKVINEVNECYRHVALVFIDLDNFKYINDTYGHEVGDKLLSEMAIKIRNIVGEETLLARFGGDEFVLLVDNLKTFDELEKVLDEIISICNIGFNVEEIEIHCTVSIGVAIFGNDGVDFDDVMKSADLAMFTAKENGKNKYEFFNDDILKKVNREIDIKEGLRKALISRELYGVLQPKVIVETREIIGFEYLLRWESEKLGFVSPAEFISIAENSGQILEIGKYVIKDGIRMCKELEPKIRKDFKIAINLSEVQLRDFSIVDFIKETLEEENVNPKNIEVEITESIIMGSPERNINILRKLKDIGITIALDDFGTGYSSLSYLTVLPIDVLKIDKSFIDNIGKDKKSEYIIETIIDLSHCFNFEVVAEGVEVLEQYNYLKEKRCDIIQGYYFSKPLPFTEVLEKLR